VKGEMQANNASKAKSKQKAKARTTLKYDGGGYKQHS
jgi:hypothetical protein